ncbi:hypothetical protein H5410_059912 [Solanum commersonii]|uniref:Uncharacterized protein n=1 Tax=Solanum commersonii TaxID=4109 RepID=A0A9J5W3T7_SOLCO|nr:hypothetical protein H5410_059912 [Solanum commersonii]
MVKQRSFVIQLNFYLILMAKGSGGPLYLRRHGGLLVAGENGEERQSWFSSGRRWCGERKALERRVGGGCEELVTAVKKVCRPKLVVRRPRVADFVEIGKGGTENGESVRWRWRRV